MKVLILALTLLLGGCGTLDGLKGQLENRVSCSLDGTQGIFNSWYGPVGIGAKVDEKDTIVMCAAIRATAAATAAKVRQVTTAASTVK